MSLLMEKDISCSDKEYWNSNKKDNYTLTTLSSDEDERGWEQLISKIFDFECDIEKNLKNEEVYSPKRVFVLKDGNKVIGTASAWYRPIYGEEYGYLHMVAVDPEYQGMGLSYIIINEAIKFIKNEGKKKVILKTDEFRKAAIKVYTNLGFKVVENRD